MGAGTQGNYPVNTNLRNVTLGLIEFTGKATAPTAYTDGAGLLATTTPFVRVSEGVIKLNLKDDYKAIYAFASVDGAVAGDDAQVQAIVVTAGSNSVTVRLQAGASNAVDDQVGNAIQVLLFLSLSDDA